MPMRAISCDSLPVIGWPRNAIAPEVGTNCPVRVLKNVLLPAPFGPIKQRSSISSKVKVMSSLGSSGSFTGVGAASACEMFTTP